jgi:hypothetical protein
MHAVRLKRGIHFYFSGKVIPRKKNTRYFPCHLCSFETESRAALKVHVVRKHSGVLETSKLRRRNRRVLRVTEESSEYTRCSLCEFKLASLDDLEEHLREHRFSFDMFLEPS